jgi:DNA repair exonuclease SbcCD ATPase subunit
MWIPDRLIIKNFMSIEDGELEFNQGKATVVVGINEFDKGQSSNGSGKSAILEAISIALRNKPLREECSTKDLVRKGCTSSEIMFSLTNSLYNRSMTIKRIIHNNTKSSELVLIIDKIEKKLTSVDEGKVEILKQLGISEKDLINFYLLNKEKYKPFHKMSDSEKREMIDRFSQSNMVDCVFDEIDSVIKSLEFQSRQLVDKSIKWDTKVNLYADDISDQQRELELLENDTEQSEGDRSKSTIEQEIEDKRELIEELKEDKEAQKTFIKQHQELLDKLEKVDEIELKIKKHKKIQAEIDEDIEDIDKDLIQAKKELRKLEQELLGVIKCPSCSYEFTVSEKPLDQSQIDNHRRAKKSKEKNISSFSKELEEAQLDESAVKQKIKKLEEKIQAINRERRQINATINTHNETIAGIDEGISNEEQFIRDLMQEINELATSDKQQVREQKIKLIEKDMEKKQLLLQEASWFHTLIKDNIAILEQERIIQVEQQSIFEQFKIHLSNQSIGALQAHANEYLRKTGSEFEIRLDGFKINKNKSISSKISVTVFKDGIESLFGPLSSGEKTRIILSLIIAPQMLINSTCPSGGFDLLFLDEIIESIDSKGIVGCLHSLNQIDRTIMFVTFGQFDQEYPYVLTVNKQPNGIARIIS